MKTTMTAMTDTGKNRRYGYAKSVALIVGLEDDSDEDNF